MEKKITFKHWMLQTEAVVRPSILYFEQRSTAQLKAQAKGEYENTSFEYKFDTSMLSSKLGKISPLMPANTKTENTSVAI